MDPAWKKTSGTGQEYFSVKFDNPSLRAPIYASRIEAEGTDVFTLTWSPGRMIKPRMRSARKAGRS